MDEGRRRFAQLHIMLAIAEVRSHAELILKGGNALRFVHAAPRSTLDIDFTSAGGLPDNADAVRQVIEDAVARQNHDANIRCRVQRVRRTPRDPARTRPTYDCSVGFQYLGDRHYMRFLKEKIDVSSAIQVEISFNDPFCEAEQVQLLPNRPTMTAASINDIIAEKMRAIVQQAERYRNRERPQDVFDIAFLLQQYPLAINVEKVARYFVIKCQSRDVAPSKSSFDNEVRERAKSRYHSDTQLDPNFELIPFDLAWKAVIDFVDTLDLPS